MNEDDIKKAVATRATTDFVWALDACILGFSISLQYQYLSRLIVIALHSQS